MDLRGRREAMVRTQIAARGVRHPAVLAALREVPRHRFAPAADLDEAHGDHPVPIGCGQTLSQPYIVGFMAEALALTGVERVLEVGSGSGYFAAVLSRLAREVVALELEPDLASRSASLLAELGYRNVTVHLADGARGWPPGAPYGAIVLSCASPEVPAALWPQLHPEGVLLAPLGSIWETQWLTRFWGGPERSERLLPVAFVPLR
ncbi:MAG TPA: rRNA adenine N-6-methyltransferase family protein [Holophagaceae bacterium]